MGPLVVLCGPTASGKTALALRIASRLPCEVVSADSRQVYRGMDIGTAKATQAERQAVPHHLLDVVDPDQPFTVADFVELGRRAVAAVHRRGRLPLLVGGTGLYIRALTEGLLPAPGEDAELRRSLLAREQEAEGYLHRRLQQVDPVLASRLHPRDRPRLVRALEVQALTGSPLSVLQEAHRFADRPYRLLKIGLAPEREELYGRIDSRAEAMLGAGLLDEVCTLQKHGFRRSLKALQTIGYRECCAHLAGELTLAEALALIQRNSRRYAKRQMTWFRRDESIIWVDSLRESAKIQSLIDFFYAG